MAKNGRPTKYKEEYVELVQSMVGDEGWSVTVFAAHIGVSRECVYNWTREIPRFSDAFTRAQLASEAHWEKRLVNDMMFNREANPQMCKLYLANRFGWSDKEKQVDVADVESDGFDEQIKKATEGAFND